MGKSCKKEDGYPTYATPSPAPAEMPWMQLRVNKHKLRMEFFQPLFRFSLMSLLSQSISWKVIIQIYKLSDAAGLVKVFFYFSFIVIVGFHKFLFATCFGAWITSPCWHNPFTVCFIWLWTLLAKLSCWIFLNSIQFGIVNIAKSPFPINWISQTLTFQLLRKI